MLVAGASGVLGREILRALGNRSVRPRALTRRRSAAASLLALGAEPFVADILDPVSLDGSCRGVQTVFSCAGANMQLGAFGNRQSFREVDWLGNRNLLDEARRAGVRRFVYVSVFAGERLRHTEYADAHERFADELRVSGLEYAILRPTGFFSFFAETLRMLQRGPALVIGTGAPRTNPVHERDVAEACVKALSGESTEMGIGGPDVFTRREIVELALETIGRRARIRSIAPAIFRGMTAPLRIANRRLHALMHFGIEVSLLDVIAPATGTRDLRSYFAGIASQELGAGSRGPG